MGGGALSRRPKIIIFRWANLNCERAKLCRWALLLQLQAAAAAVIGCDTARLKTAAERPLMQIFANLLRWLVQGGARKAHVKRADDLLKKLSRSLSSK